jgi:hypothetical protein
MVSPAYLVATLTNCPLVLLLSASPLALETVGIVDSNKEEHALGKGSECLQELPRVDASMPIAEHHRTSDPQ